MCCLIFENCSAHAYDCLLINIRINIYDPVREEVLENSHLRDRERRNPFEFNQSPQAKFIERRAVQIVGQMSEREKEDRKRSFTEDEVSDKRRKGKQIRIAILVRTERRKRKSADCV